MPKAKMEPLTFTTSAEEFVRGIHRARIDLGTDAAAPVLMLESARSAARHLARLRQSKVNGAAKARRKRRSAVPDELLRGLVAKHAVGAGTYKEAHARVRSAVLGVDRRKMPPNERPGVGLRTVTKIVKTLQRRDPKLLQHQ